MLGMEALLYRGWDSVFECRTYDDLMFSLIHL